MIKTKDVLSLFSFWADRYDAELYQTIVSARALTRAKRPQYLEITDLQMALLECLTAYSPSGPMPTDMRICTVDHSGRDAWVKAHTGLDPL